ncbi:MULTISPECIES: ATP12 family protein [Novosphingobium]|uniref:ATP12 family protein n=1 Tax=Novosphingobium TaxID=165696 RepID=UPI001CD3F45C|nr:ATP12 family protein [Novosphingobium percolationis]
MKRFYKEVTVAGEGEGFRVMLDGRGIRTVAGSPQVVPTATLAEALAAEWAGQREEIDPARFILRDMADYALDVVAPDRARAIVELMPYVETDTLCYRAEPDEPLAARQHAVWEPLLEAVEARHGVCFRRVAGIMHQPQPEETIAALRMVIEGLDAFALAALRNTTSLAASLVIGVEAILPDADLDALWNAANLEEDWQVELWGRDEEAMERRERRHAAFVAAARFAALSRG